MNIFIMQNSIVRPLGRDAQNALIGFEGENDARTFVIRTQDGVADYTVSLIIGEVDCGAMTKATMPDGSTMLSLTLASNMLGKGGDKVCQLLMTKDTIVRKSSQFRAYVGESNDINGTAPDSATIIIISEKITELAHEAALDAIEEVQEVIDSIPSDYSTLSDQVDTNTTAIALKADQATTYTKTEVDQMIEDVEVETDTTLTIEGAAADAAETGRQIDLLKADLGAYVQTITWTDGWYITTSGSTVTPANATALATYRTATLRVREGDKCVLHTQSGVSPRAWCFVDSSYNVISAADSNAVCDGIELTVPANAAYLILNDMLKSETASYYLQTLKNSTKDITEELALTDAAAAVAVDATAPTVRAVILGLLKDAAYETNTDRSAAYSLLSVWVASTPTKYGDRAYHLEDQSFDGETEIETTLALQNADRDFTIAITLTPDSTNPNNLSRVFGMIGSVGNTVYGFGLNTYRVMVDGVYTNLGYAYNYQVPVKIIFRHVANSNVLEVIHKTELDKVAHTLTFAYTPNPANNYVLKFGATADGNNHYVGDIDDFSYYLSAWSDTLVNAYMENAL